MKDDLIGRLEKRASEWDAKVDGWLKQAEDAGQKADAETERVMRDTIYRESKDEIERLRARVAELEAECRA